MKKVAVFIGVFVIAAVFAQFAYAQTKFSVAEMARSSEAVVVAKVAKINKAVDPPQVHVNVTSTLKGKTPNKLIVSLLADDAGGNDPKAAAFKPNASYLLFIIQVENPFAFLFQNLSGKLEVQSGKWLEAHTTLVKGLEALDKAPSNFERTRRIVQYLDSPHEIVQEMALTEVQLKSSSYETNALKPKIQKHISSPNEDVRKRALMALVRVYAADSETGYSQDLNLIKVLIDKLNDKSLEIREYANQQLRAHTRKTVEFDPKGSPEERKKGFAEWEKWYKEEKAAKEQSGK